MNGFIRAVKNAELAVVKEMLQKDAKWIGWSEKDGKNALHYLCGLERTSIKQIKRAFPLRNGPK
ncbi:hypothetical protein [Paenibacillus humicola]|uniref:hypothetical protein n=1 Tax=Paenibacillus humicola TaxID=3110540 RepID=UPI00237AF7D7|nr:hypothetical protein [Paenibacillus humicola]